MNRRTELLVYMGVTAATIAGLFTLQAWYATYLDVSVVHGKHGEISPDAKLSAAREAERAKLSSGRMSIDAAKKALASQGRTVSDRIAPKASDDLSAMSGWVYRRGFKPYEPRTGVASTTNAQPAAPQEQAP